MVLRCWCDYFLLLSFSHKCNSEVFNQEQAQHVLDKHLNIPQQINGFQLVRYTQEAEGSHLNMVINFIYSNQIVYSDIICIRSVQPPLCLLRLSWPHLSYRLNGKLADQLYSLIMTRNTLKMPFQEPSTPHLDLSTVM